MQPVSKDFFSRQLTALQTSRILIAVFILTTLAVSAGAGFFFEYYHFVFFHSDRYSTKLYGPQHSHWLILSAVFLVTVLAGSISMFFKFKNEGMFNLLVSAGVEPILPNPKRFEEQQFLNIIEEMSIASGLPIPEAFILRGDFSINAFTAGLTPSTACICATEGALDSLSRVELQGIVAHEFSHILHGDVLFNTKMIGILNGYIMFTKIGYFLIRISRGGRNSGKKGGGTLFFGLGLLFFTIGNIGMFLTALLRAAFNRQREWLADASAVQFTRDQGGIRGALIKIDRISNNTISNREIGEVYSHMCFVKAVSGFWSYIFASHPPTKKRIRELGRPDYESPRIDLEKLEDSVMRGFSPQSVNPSSNGSMSNNLPVDPKNSQLRASKAHIDRSFSFSEPGSMSEDALARARNSMSRIPDRLLKEILVSHKALAVITGIVVFLGCKNPVESLANYKILKIESLTFFDYIRDEVFPMLKNLDDSQLFIISHLAGKPLAKQEPQELLRELEVLSRIIESDHKTEAVEMSLLITFVALIADKVNLKKYKIQGEPDALSDISLLVGFVAKLSSSGSSSAAEHSYQIAAQVLGIKHAYPSEEINDTAGLLRAVGHVKAFSIQNRMRFVQALLECIKSDNHVNESEYFALRSICTVLDCPFPFA